MSFRTKVMKIAVITSVFGGMDEPKPFAVQSLPEGFTCDRFYFTEANSPPLPNLPPRLQAKYFKTQSHHIPDLERHDIHVWIDGNIEVRNGGFVSAIIYPLFGNGFPKVSIQAHHERSTISEEIEFILDSMDNSYLRTRYSKQPLADEYAHYIAQGMPPTAPLYSCNVFARRVGKVSNDMWDAWWRLCIEWSWFDQSAFSYLAWQAKDIVYTVDLGGVCTSPYYTLHPHNEWNQ